MEDFVEALNRTKIEVSSPVGTIRLEHTEKELAFRRLVTSWHKSGPNLRALLEGDPDLKRRTRSGITTLYPTPTGRGYLDWHPAPTESANEAQDEALRDFMRLTTNPLWDLLAGPCYRCGDYFLRDTRRKRIYCSRGCSATVTALSATSRRRREEHQAKVHRVQSAIQQWQRMKARPANWKKWVTSKPDITLHWLSRAVNSGSVKPPTSMR